MKYNPYFLLAKNRYFSFGKTKKSINKETQTKVKIPISFLLPKFGNTT
jgi:hypothetical protein